MANNTLEELKLYVSNSTFVDNYPEFCFTQSSVQNPFFRFKLTTGIAWNMLKGDFAWACQYAGFTAVSSPLCSCIQRALALCAWNGSVAQSRRGTCQRDTSGSSTGFHCNVYKVLERPLPAQKIIIISEFCLEAKDRKAIWHWDKRQWLYCFTNPCICSWSLAAIGDGNHAFVNPEQSNYIFRRNHLEDNQFHCKHPGIQQLNMALLGMTSLKLCLCCCVTPSVYYNLVAGTIWLSAYCVRSPVVGCCHHSVVVALWWEAGLEVGSSRRGVEAQRRNFFTAAG